MRCLLCGAEMRLENEAGGDTVHWAAGMSSSDFFCTEMQT